ncbi:MAG: hypothetical protein IH964_05665 [Candidatus Dadabacteria bacterium]|nr:hypothetical protein [Candidatus Dadabacteria bacterium]
MKIYEEIPRNIRKKIQLLIKRNVFLDLDVEDEQIILELFNLFRVDFYMVNLITKNQVQKMMRREKEGETFLNLEKKPLYKFRHI